MENGTFLDSDYLPGLGYARQSELVDDEVRRKHQLPPRERSLDLDDPAAPANNYITHDADRIRFEATVSTSADQRVIAPGSAGARSGPRAAGATSTTWRNGRSSTSSPSSPGGTWSSATPGTAIALEIAHHPEHTYDLPRMFRGMKDGLEYFSRNFGPYQHPVLRIVEFPGYATFAQSFSSTVPFSESIGFIAEVQKNKPDAIDYPLYVTAHEVAHHWWGHQVLSADSQGMTALVETLAQYSALMVMKHAYGPQAMRRFLRYELDRYLSGRSAEKKKELPLLRVEDQGYIHYSKGSLVMYGLQDLIGEDAVNQALRELVQQYGDRGAPYPTARVLVAALRRHTPEQFQYYLTDQFEEITLYENRVHSASARHRSDGRYDVTLELATHKFRADALGSEHEVPMNDWLPVGAVDAEGNAVVLEKRKIDAAHLDGDPGGRSTSGTGGDRSGERADRSDPRGQCDGGDSRPLGPPGGLGAWRTRPTFRRDMAAVENKARRRPWHRRWWVWTLGAVVVLAVAFAIALQPLARYATRRALDSVEGYRGSFEDAHLSILPLRYRVTKLKLEPRTAHGRRSTPTSSAPAWTGSGCCTGGSVSRPRCTRGTSSSARRRGRRRPRTCPTWPASSRRSFPGQLHRVQVRDSELTYVFRSEKSPEGQGEAGREGPAHRPQAVDPRRGGHGGEPGLPARLRRGSDDLRRQRHGEQVGAGVGLRHRRPAGLQGNDLRRPDEPQGT